MTATHDLDELCELAVDLAARAAARHGRGGTGTVDTKSSPTDPVTEVDRDAERLIVEGIDDARPGDAILGEEGAARDGSTGVRWVIDPLDGTVNYMYGFPSHAVSIAVEMDGVPTIGVVHDTSRSELFVAVGGRGATCNDEELRVSDKSELHTALLATGFAYAADSRRRQAAIVAHLLPEVRDIRRAGSCAVDLCSVAAGRVDAFYEVGPHWWDVAAGLVIVSEAGGVCHWDPDAGRVVASGPTLHPPLDRLLRDAEAGASPAGA